MNRLTVVASQRILALVAQGLSPVDALRQVCGTEATDQMIDALYVALRTKA